MADDSPKMTIRLSEKMSKLLNRVSDGSKAFTIRKSLEQHYSFGWVVYSITRTHNRYYGIVESSEYFASDSYLDVLINHHPIIGNELLIHPISEFDIKAVGCFAYKEDALDYAVLMSNRWLNTGGYLYNTKDFTRVFEVGVNYEVSRKIVAICLKKKISVQKLLVKLLSKYMDAQG